MALVAVKVRTGCRPHRSPRVSDVYLFASFPCQDYPYVGVVPLEYDLLLVVVARVLDARCVRLLVLPLALQLRQDPLRDLHQALQAQDQLGNPEAQRQNHDGLVLLLLIVELVSISVVVLEI